MQRRVIDFSLNHPRWVIAIALLITLVFAIQFPRIRIDTDPENMLASDAPVRITHSQIKDDFGLYDHIVLGIVDTAGVFTPEMLARVAAITDEIMEIEGVIADDVIAPTVVDNITQEDGALRVAPLMEEVPEDLAGAQRLLAEALDNPLLRGKLASDDGRALALFVPLESKEHSYEISQEIMTIVEQHRGATETYHLAGLPVAEDTFGAEMFKQMGISAPLAGLILFLLMLAFFRNARLVAAPMLVAVMAVIWAMGFLIGTGFPVHIMSSMIPIFLIPVAVLDSVHILSELHDEYRRRGDMRATVRKTMQSLWTPMLLTSITTVVGFGSLMWTPIPPVRVFGGFVAFGVATAWLLSVTVIPALAVLMSPKSLSRFGGDESGGFVAGLAHRLGALALGWRRGLVIVSALLLVVSIFGLRQIQVNDNPVNWFKSGHPIRVADEVMNDYLAGTYMVYLTLGGDEVNLKDPATMRYIEELQGFIATQPHVGGVTSIADIVKKVRYEVADRDPAALALPDSQDEIAQYLFLYEISGGDPEDLFKFMTPEADRANIWIQFRRGENRFISAVTEEIERYLGEHPGPVAIEHQWAGLSYVNVVWQDEMVRGMATSLMGAFVIVLILMTLLFRSIVWGLVSILPLSLTIAIIYALVGFTGKDFDMPIAVLSSLTLGLSIDFAIHFIQRLRDGYRQSGDHEQALRGMFDAPARAVVRNVLVIAIGFVPMFFATLVPYITVGIFFVIIMLVSGFATLLLLPALTSLAPRRFFPAQQGKAV